jgi:hypothetical protein
MEFRYSSHILGADESPLALEFGINGPDGYSLPDVIINVEKHYGA